MWWRSFILCYYWTSLDHRPVWPHGYLQDKVFYSIYKRNASRYFKKNFLAVILFFRNTLQMVTWVFCIHGIKDWLHWCMILPITGKLKKDEINTESRKMIFSTSVDNFDNIFAIQITDFCEKILGCWSTLFTKFITINMMKQLYTKNYKFLICPSRSMYIFFWDNLYACLNQAGVHYITTLGELTCARNTGKF